jgi:hypothetical protein
VSPPRGNLDELPGLLAELREVVRDAHCAIKDLRAAIKEARQVADDAARAAEARAAAAAAAEMKRWESHIQGEMNRQAAELNLAIAAARDHIALSLMPRIAEVDLTDSEEPARLRIAFVGGGFDADIPTGRPG